MKTRNLVKRMQPAVVEREKTFDTPTALEILKKFYLEAKKEIKKNDETYVKLRSGEVASHLTFTCDGFNLELTFTDHP
jgi:hypothetical protein